MNFKERKNLLEGKQQVHLLRFLDQLNDDEKQILFSQIDAVDWGFEQAFHNDKKKEDTMIEEIDALHLDKIQADSERYRSIGLQAIKEGKLCLLLLAGGQGTRLGFDKPKGCFNVGITKELYIFQLLIEHTLDIVRAADAWIPLYIMTSNINYQDTVTFFEAHDYFGYNPAYVHFFVQELNPATDFNGKILLKSKYELALSPNGNGGWFSSMPKDYAFDFLLFCMRNPKPCPILEVGDVGSKQFRTMASEGDVCKDFPKYRIWRNGVLEKEVTDITDYWQDDFVYFLIGCSFSFESELLEADVPVRHIQENKNVPMFNTNIELQSAGKFHGNMVVSMRPIPNDLVVKAVNVTASMPRVHGAPIQIGNPEAIGIKDVTKPDYGDSVTINEGEIPVFWACGVTPQNAVMQTKPEIAITHSPGHMFITDVKNVNLKY